MPLKQTFTQNLTKLKIGNHFARFDVPLKTLPAQNVVIFHSAREYGTSHSRDSSHDVDS